jgi:hypothetical protein
MVASLLGVARDEIGAGLQDEKRDGEESPFAEHIDFFFDTS